MNLYQACREVALGYMIVIAIIMLGLVASATHITRAEHGRYGWAAVARGSTDKIFVLGLVTCVLSIVSLPFFIVFNLCVILELIWMNVLWILWMTEAILVSIYRGETQDHNIYYPGFRQGTLPHGHIVAIQAFAFMLFIIGFLYVFAFCLYALGSRVRGEESMGAVMRSWRLSVFEPSHPSRQIIVIQAPESTARRAPGVFDPSGPIFTDCHCGCHTIHPTDPATSDLKDSKISV